MIGPRLALTITHGQPAKQAQLVLTVENGSVEVLDETGGFGKTRDGFKVSWDGADTAGQTVKVRITGTSKRILKGERHERA